MNKCVCMDKVVQARIREYLFIGVAFLLGSVNILYNIPFYVLWVLAALFFIWTGYDGFVARVKRNWKYLMLPLAGVVYLGIHYLISLWVGYDRYAASGKKLDLLLMYFFFIPVYLVAAKDFMTPSLLKRSLLALCWGTLLFNFVKLFYLTGWTLFTDTGEAAEMLYNSRFGCHLHFLGGHVYLEPQAIYLSVSAVLGFFFVVRGMGQSDRKTLVQGTILLILSLWFLSLTVTKGAILAFLVGFLILAVVYFCRMSLKQRLFTGAVVVLLLAGACVFVPDTYVKRMKEARNEIERLQEGKWQGGSIVPRLALIKESVDRIDEWGLWGLGLYKNAAAKEWFRRSNVAEITSLGSNVHNCFLEFWMMGGLAGLFFILYYFFVPVVRMIRARQCSFVVLAILSVLFVGCNTSILIIFVDSAPLVIFLLAMSFFYLDQFIELE